MALVAYSDSEDSEAEKTPQPITQDIPKAAFKRTEPRKIKVDLPSVQAQPATQDEQPPAKRAKIGGSFGGFNSFLPAPKRAAQNGPKAGVSLRTSSEAAFSREAPLAAAVESIEYKPEGAGEVIGSPARAEVKLVGKATRFKPLSVGNKKPKKRVVVKEATERKPPGAEEDEVPKAALAGPGTAQPKEKRSLFSVQQDDGAPATEPTGTTYEYDSITVENPDLMSIAANTTTHPPVPEPSSAPANALEAVAADLNLTPAQRRHLFGRNSKGASANVNVAHFDLDSEYAHNEQLRQNGEAFEHKAVKSIAPGKHSLQQLVNNARSNQDSIEDKWAADRAKRGAGTGGR